MRRKILARMVLVLIVSVIILPVINISAKGSDDEWAGYWTYSKSVVIEHSNELASYYSSNPNDQTRISYTADKNKIDYKFNYTGSGYNTELYEDALQKPGDYENTKIILQGEHAYLDVTLGDTAKQYRENGELSIPLSVNIYDEYTYYFKDIKFSLLAWTHVYDASKIDYNSENMAGNSRLSDRLDMPGGKYGILNELSPADNQKVDNQPITGNAPYGINNGDIMVIEIEINFDSSSPLVYSSLDGSIELEYDSIKIYHFYTWKYGANSMVLNTDAADFPGENKGVSIPTIIMNGILGIGAALAAAAGSDGGDDNRKKKSSYKMYMQKDFGDAIRYNKPPVTVYARIVEITPEGEEIDRPDLTTKIEISSGGGLKVENTAMAGNYMGALVCAESQSIENQASSGVLCVRLSDNESSFTNNVTFRLVGDAHICTDKETLSILVGSEETFYVPIRFEDFINAPEKISVKPFSEGDAELSYERDTDGNHFVTAKSIKPKPDFPQRPYDTVGYEIIAENKDEYARSVFYIALCYEGIFADFYGKNSEIIAYKNSEDKMSETLIAFKAKVWNNESKELDDVFPEDFSSEYEDEHEVGKTIGVNYTEKERKDGEIFYVFTVEKNLPAPEKIRGKLIYSCMSANCIFRNETECTLVPDMQTYENDLAKEYENCRKIITDYMPEPMKNRKLDELEKLRKVAGLKDLQLFRQKVWGIASRMILQEKENYLIESYWRDEQIATAELVVSVGDLAFEVALSAAGGPLAGFVLKNVKGLAIDAVTLYTERGGIGWEEISEMASNTLKSNLGNLDDFVEMPDKTEPKKLAMWLASYTFYRIMYHWYYDVDESGARLGICEAVKSALTDLSGKGLQIILTDFCKKNLEKSKKDFGKTRNTIYGNLEKSGRIEEELVNDAIRKGIDTGDVIADKLDNAISELVTAIKEFIASLK